MTQTPVNVTHPLLAARLLAQLRESLRGELPDSWRTNIEAAIAAGEAGELLIALD